MSAFRSLLLPLTPLYRLALDLRERRLASGREPIRRLRYPVISIGNLSTGGAGKTPLTIAIAQALAARGLVVDVLSRGYGRRSHLAEKVNVQGPADQYGDEPLLIARAASLPAESKFQSAPAAPAPPQVAVFVAPQRYDAGLLAESGQELAVRQVPAQPELAPPQVHILDDGFQHRQLHRELDILLLSRAELNDRLFPAGNLREPLRAAERAHILAIPATDPILESDLRARGLTQPFWRLHRRMQIPPDLTGKPVLAFCGIARPEQFFSGLKENAVEVAACNAFPDHHRYSSRDLQSLAVKAKAAGAATLLTTEKDAIRLAGLDSPLPILTVPLRTEIEDLPAALDWLLAHLNLAQLNG